MIYIINEKAVSLLLIEDAQMTKMNLFNSNTTLCGQKWWRHIITLLLAIVIGWVLWYISSIPDYMKLTPAERQHEFFRDLWQTALETTILFELAILYSKLIIKVLWSHSHTFGRLLIQCVVLLILNFTFSGLTGWLYTKLDPELLDNGVQFRIMFCDGITVYFVTSIYFISYLLNRHQEESEKAIKAENISIREKAVALQSKLDKLALQTNNHFVFNCFSTLDGLISTNSEKARPFLRNLSNIYRYLVANADKHIIPLKDEMAFAREYIEITRFRYSGISFLLKDDIERTDGYIVPVSVQQLVENAVKHNRHGKDDHLQIEIVIEDGVVRVSNNVLPREDEFDSTGQGLKTLQDRFLLVSQKGIKVVNDGHTFTVELPILYFED